MSYLLNFPIRRTIKSELWINVFRVHFPCNMPYCILILHICTSYIILLSKILLLGFGMTIFVVMDIRRRGKSIVTISTLVRFLLCMSPRMLLQISFICKYFPTLLALKFWFCVYPVNMLLEFLFFLIRLWAVFVRTHTYFMSHGMSLWVLI